MIPFLKKNFIKNFEKNKLLYLITKKIDELQVFCNLQLRVYACILSESDCLAEQ